MSTSSGQTCPGYPPVLPCPPGGGGGGGPGGGGGGTTFDPGPAGTLSGASTGSGGGTGSTSGDNGPFCDLEHCLRYAGETGGRFVNGKVEERGNIRVAAVQGCCKQGSRVDVYIESVRAFLGTVFAAEDGSYRGEFTLPASITPGKHHIIANIEGCGELSGELEVLPAGTSVLGTTVTNTGAVDSKGGGILPRTGRDLLRLLLWALILIAIGTLLVRAKRRWGKRFKPVRAMSGRFARTRSAGPFPALPAPDVPFLDTSRFVPYATRAPSGRPVRRAARPSRGTTVTEWDTEQRNDFPS